MLTEDLIQRSFQGQGLTQISCGREVPPFLNIGQFQATATECLRLGNLIVFS